MARIIPVLLIISVLLSSCRSCNKDQDANKEFDIPEELMSDEQPLPVSSEVIDEIVQNVSSPVETAALIKGLKVPFNKDYMATTGSAKNMNTSFQKALGLGIYGADLGYLNMYEKTTVVIDYISTVKELADGIQVGQFFDFNTLRRIATNKENLDSLMLISQQSFNKIDSYLRETNRASLSVVIIAGVWLEGLYLSTRVAQDANHPRINETIGEQKVIMGTLMALLNNYKRDPNIASLISDFEEIKDLYKDVTITYEIGGEPTPVVKDGVLTFTQNDVQTITMSDETLQAIITKVQTLRNKLIS
jgi:hypothetical protein